MIHKLQESRCWKSKTRYVVGRIENKQLSIRLDFIVLLVMFMSARKWHPALYPPTTRRRFSNPESGAPRPTTPGYPDAPSSIDHANSPISKFRVQRFRWRYYLKREHLIYRTVCQSDRQYSGPKNTHISLSEYVTYGELQRRRESCE